MKAQEIMTPHPRTCSAHDTMQSVARMMRDHDCGCVPVADEKSGKVIGIVTDRDITIRGTAEGKLPGTDVDELMTPGPICCLPTEDIADVEGKMSEAQVRRVPIVDLAGHCVGIIAQADFARSARNDRISERDIARLVEKISEPGPAKPVNKPAQKPRKPAAKRELKRAS